MIATLKPIAAIAVGLLMALAMTGCRPNEYADTANLDAGNAIAANKAIQTVDPWPRSAFDRHHTTNAQRTENAYGKYEGARATPAKNDAPQAQ